MIQKDDAGDSISACDDDDDSLFLITCVHIKLENALVQHKQMA